MFCTKCGCELQDDAAFCSNCGNQIENKNSSEKTHVKISKKLIIPAVFIVIAILAVFAFLLGGESEIESTAKEYVKQLKEIDNVREINAITCIRSVTDEGEERFGYIIYYIKDNYKSEIAYFINGEYRGNGYNGGDSNGEEYEVFANMSVLMASIEVLEFIDENNLDSHGSYEKYYEVEEGIIYIKLTDVLTWIDNY